MRKIVVYSKPRCVQCDAVKRKFDQAGVAYIEANLLELPREAVEELMEAGHRTAPIVSIISDDGSLYDEFSGYDPQKTREAIAYMKGGGGGDAA